MPENQAVAILLSTYNGARFLPAQLESIAAQSHRDWRLFVRDDGSTDDTVGVLSRFSAAHPERVSVERGPNLGAVASFFALLARRDLAADAVAFCDQDDVWHADKLARALGRLTHFGPRPALYCSRAELVGSDLEPIGLSPLARFVGFDNAIYENIAMGCTTMLNRAAHELVSSRLPARPVVIHDWWCYLVVAALGEVVYDPAPSIKYRLHTANVVGLPASASAALFRHARRLWRAPATFYRPHRQAQELLACFGDRLSPARRATVEEFVAAKPDLGRRVRLALGGRVLRQRRLDAVVARVLIAFGLY